MTTQTPTRQRPRRLRALGAACVLSALCALSAQRIDAHELPTERQIIVQLGQSHASVLISLEDPRKELAGVVFARYDLNRDGELDERETALAARMLVPMALQGLELEIPGEAPQAEQEPKIKVKRTPNGQLIMWALMTYKLPANAAQRQFKVSLKQDRRYPAVLLRFDALEPATLTGITTANGPLKKNSPITLGPGYWALGSFSLAPSPSEK